jgi:hypothetical protein
MTDFLARRAGWVGYELRTRWKCNQTGHGFKAKTQVVGNMATYGGNTEPTGEKGQDHMQMIFALPVPARQAA